jgi:hypothetical protein
MGNDKSKLSASSKKPVEATFAGMSQEELFSSVKSLPDDEGFEDTERSRSTKIKKYRKSRRSKSSRDLAESSTSASGIATSAENVGKTHHPRSTRGLITNDTDIPEDSAFADDAYDLEEKQRSPTYTVTVEEVAAFQLRLIETVAEILGAPLDCTYLLLEHFGYGGRCVSLQINSSSLRWDKETLLQEVFGDDGPARQLAAGVVLS